MMTVFGIIVVLVFARFIYLAIKEKNQQDKERAYHQYQKKYPLITSQLMKQYMSGGLTYQDSILQIGGIPDGIMYNDEMFILDNEFQLKVEMHPDRKTHHMAFLLEAKSAEVNSNTRYDLSQRSTIIRQFLYTPFEYKRYVLEHLQELDQYIKRHAPRV
jgi:hypothetical protein